MTDKYCDADYQGSVSDFVSQEVIYCVSHLVWELAQQWENFPDYEDELLNAYRGLPDYKEPASDEVRTWDHETCREYLESYGFSVQDSEPIDTLRDTVLQCAIDEGIEDFCDSNNIEPYECEIFGHWLVSSWLADRLETRGERVLSDFFGLTVWCRSTTGQAIYMDRVICDIYDELHAS